MALVCYTGGSSCCMPSSAQQGHLRRSAPPSRMRHSSPLLLASLRGSEEGGGGREASHVVCARRGLSSRTRRLEDRGKKGGRTSAPLKEQSEGEGGGGGGGIGEGDALSLSSVDGGLLGTGAAEGAVPELPGLQPDFWEGPQWDAFGFVMQYLWAFGIVFALIACGIAVATYNEGATDFKQTPAYKESIQSRELLEEPDSSSSDVFEANPTEAAPSLE